MMTQMNLLTKHVMGGGSNSVNAVSLSRIKSYEDDMFDSLYNEDVQFLSNKVWGSCHTFQRQGESQGRNKGGEVKWRNKERDGNWRNNEREWRDQNNGWGSVRMKEIVMYPLMIQKPKGTNADPEILGTNDILAHILNKI